MYSNAHHYFFTSFQIVILKCRVFFSLGKSIDFHQLDFDALKSPVCSDITESGETMALKVHKIEH